MTKEAIQVARDCVALIESARLHDIGSFTPKTKNEILRGLVKAIRERFEDAFAPMCPEGHEKGSKKGCILCEDYQNE